MNGQEAKHENFIRDHGTDHLVGGHNELKGTGCNALVE